MFRKLLSPHVRRPAKLLLAVAVVLIVALGSAPGKAAANYAGLSIQDLAYSPASIEVAVGDTVTWTNSEVTMPHDVTSGQADQADAGQAFASEILMPNASYSFTFSTPGEYAYFCRLHPTMLGVVIVRPS